MYISSVVPPKVRDKIVEAYKRIHGEDKVFVSPNEEYQAALDRSAKIEIPDAKIKVDLPLVGILHNGVSLRMATEPRVHFISFL